MKTLILGFLMGTGLCSVLLFWGLCRGLFDRACGKEGPQGPPGIPGEQGPAGLSAEPLNSTSGGEILPVVEYTPFTRRGKRRIKRKK